MKTRRSTTGLLALVAFFIVTACDIDIAGPNGHVGPIDVGPVGPGPGDTLNFAASATFSLSIPVTGQPLFHLRGVSGSVTIVASDVAASIQVTGQRRVRSSSQEDADQFLAQLQVKITEGAEEILVETQQPQGDFRNYEVDYTVVLPRQMKLRLFNINGSVSLDGLAEDLKVELTNGKIGASVGMPTGGTIDLRTVNGEIELEIPQDASARLTASLTHGTISTSNLTLLNRVATARTLTATLGAGAGRIRLALVNGDITVKGR